MVTIKNSLLTVLFSMSFFGQIQAQKLDSYIGTAIGIAYMGSTLIKTVKQKTNRPNTSYVPNENWPTKGYNIGSSGIYPHIKECLLQKFADQDSIYYLKVIKEGMKEESFYYMLLNKEQVEAILNNTLNKKLMPKRIDRGEWYKTLLKKTNIDNANNYKGNEYWTYFKPKAVFLKNDPDAIPNERVRGMGKQQFTYKVAYQNYLEKHDLDSNGNPIPFERKLIAFYMALKIMGYISPEGKYKCNGQVFNSIADMEDYKNAQGLK